MGFILLLVVSVRLVIKVPLVQTWLVKRAALWLSSELQVQVAVKAVDIKFFRSVEIEGLFVQDQQRDTMVYIPVLTAEIGSFNFNTQKLVFSSITIDQARIGIKRYASPRAYNLDFLIDYFSSPSTDTLPKAPWQLKIKSVQLTDCHLSYRDLKYNDRSSGIDWDDLVLRNLNVKVDDLQPVGDTLSFTVRHISFTERSGFKVNDFAANAAFAPGHMEFGELWIKSDSSDIHTDIRFDYTDMDDFQEFITDVRWKGDFKKSKIYFGDLTFFASELSNLNRRIELSGKFSGTVDRFKGKQVNLRYSDNTYFRGNVSMSGLPDFEETYMEIKVDQLGFNKREIETIPAWPFDSLKLIRLPEQIAHLGNVVFKGSFNGFYNDFVAYGNINTALGFISSDLNLKIDDSDRKTAYAGKLVLDEFDAGRLWDMQDLLGKTSLKVEVSGKGFDLKNVDANISGEISVLEFYGYRYQGIALNGHIAQKLFTGALQIDDQHLALGFDGVIDLSKEMPAYNFNASVHQADLTELGWLKRDSPASLRADFAISIVGNSIDNAQGNLQIDDLIYREGNKKISTDRIYIESEIGQKREMRLQSDIADAQITGDFTFSALPQTWKHFVSNYFPALLEKDSYRPISQQFDFFVQLKHTREVLEIFSPGLIIQPETRLDGSIHSDLSQMSLLLKSGAITVNGVELTDIDIDGHTEAGDLKFGSSLGEIALNDSVSLTKVSVNGFTNRDTADVLVRFAGEDSSYSGFSSRFRAGFLNTGYTLITIQPERLLYHGQPWTLDTRNYILADSTGFLFNNLNLSNQSQRIGLSGILGQDSSARLQIDFSDFQLAMLNDILSPYKVNLGGIANGFIEFSSVGKRPALNASVDVEGLTWFGDSLGDAEVLADWDSESNRIDVTGNVTRGGLKNIQVSGYYEVNEQEDEMDFTAKIQKTYLQSFSHYLDGLASNVSGIVSGELYLKGSAKKPALTGKLLLQKVGFTIDYLKANYSFSTELDFLKDKIVLKEVKLNDAKGNVSVASGEIRHNYLEDFELDIDVKLNKAQVLNTGPADNDIFYGSAFASGSVSIDGPLDYITMKIGLKSEKGTKISLPLSNPEEVSRSGFVNFISTVRDTASQESSGPDLSGIELSMDFEITKDASIYLIFDSKIGDVIEGRGDGNLTMTISPTEDLKMFGNFTIDEGKYLFTMQNIINKPFYIDKGGSIRWTGDPYDAEVNLKAIYRLRAGLYDLFQDSSFRKLVPVDLNLQLTNKLFNPNIGFEIVVQNIDPNTANQVKRLINTEEETYRQAVSLLVMRRFSPPSEISNRTAINTGGVVGANAYEMLSNQLSNWASQISNQVNVGVNYRPGDAITSEELEVALSTSFFNDRVTVDGNVGMANTNAAQPSAGSNQNASNLIGDFTVEVKARRDGRLRFKAFNRSNNNSLINNVNSPYTQGVGVFYSLEFDSFKELPQRIANIFRRKSNKKDVNGQNKKG